MIDENLPTFYFRHAKDNPRQDASIHLSQYGGDAAPAYALRYPDPAAPTAKNRYAVGLYDAHAPDVLYGEVLLTPDWTQPPAPSADELRRTGGVPPPPQPQLPKEFVVQLYNPDQQIAIRQTPGGWGGAPHWDFSLPQETFRQPSASGLDRGRSDPGADAATPRSEFRWRREGKWSRDLLCALSGKSTKRRHKEPDIPLAFFRGLRDLSLYEPNLMRVDLEDPKGFEVVLLLGATVIRDVYFHADLAAAFNIVAPPGQLAGGPGARRRSSGNRTAAAAAAATAAPVAPLAPSNRIPTPLQSLRPPPPQAGPPPPGGGHHTHPTLPPRPPPTDPRSQWEIDAETARLTVASRAEEATTRRQREKREAADRAAAKKLQKEEERERARRQKEVERETERLRLQFEKEAKAAAAGGKGGGGGGGKDAGGEHHRRRRKSAGERPAHDSRHHHQYHGGQPQQQVPILQAPSFPPRHSAPLQPPGPYAPPPPAQGYLQPGPYLQAPPASSGNVTGGGQQTLRPKRSSFLGISFGGQDEQRVQKKKSSVF